MNQLMSVEAASDLIRRGLPLSIAGPESALDALPQGAWIGGTIPYFMVEEGGIVVRDERVFVTELSGLGQVRIASYGPDELACISGGAPDNSVQLTIIPAGSDTLRRFSAEAAGYDQAFVKPAVGWIAGVHLSELGQRRPQVYDGSTGLKYDDRAVVAHLSLPDDKLALIEIVNLFEPDGGDVIRFDQMSDQVGTCRVNGEEVRLADYIRGRGLAHGRLPLVGDFAGAHINVSLQKVGDDTVSFYAPVFPGVDYHFARPVEDYAAAFRQALSQRDLGGAVLSCNCILNFLFGELEGKAIGGVQGPITFGEIGYQLLNQTLVVLRVV